MAWINYKKAYDMVLQSRIIDCLKIYKIFGEVIKFIEKTRKLEIETDSRGKSLAEEKI